MTRCAVKLAYGFREHTDRTNECYDRVLSHDDDSPTHTHQHPRHMLFNIVNELPDVIVYAFVIPPTDLSGNA